MIQYDSIDGLLLRDMVLAGTALLEKNREAVDALNVFPVPDGDTGTNMTLTMQSACREVSSKEFLRADEAAAALAKGALRGARGNSGVITSQLFRGFSKAVAGMERITPEQFAAALKKGAELAYKAVMKPKEGTILTVARVIAEDAIKQAAAAPTDYDGLMNVMLKSGEAILKKTPDMLPALKAANVVDSGGRGLLWIYTGYAAVIRGEDINALLLSAGDEAGEEAEDPDDLDKINFDYCVRFSIQNFGEDITESDRDSFRRRLKRIGDSVQVTGDLECTKVHVHTDNPGDALQFAIDLGEVVDITIENLGAKKRALAAAAEAEKKAAEEAEKPRKPYGMVAVSLGQGFSDIFRELTVDSIVEGGQTMNPSTDDILSAIEGVNADCVFVFPNNGNVVLAAEQAAKMATRKVYVIPTKNVAMGIAAAVSFQPDAAPEENVALMSEASEHVKTATLTYAVRDSEYDGVQIKQGDIIGLHNGKIEFSGQDVEQVAMNVMDAIVDEEAELITVYYGADVTKEDAEALTATVSERYPDCDVECHMGGMPLYYYLISVE